MTRTLEVGVRKAIGATRHQLSNQFLAEAIVVSLIAIVVGMGLAEAVLPTFNAVVHQELEIKWLSVETGIGALTLALVVGVLSGLYPAQVVARLHPVRALSRKTPQPGRGLLGRGLIVVQFALSAVLVVVTITMARQLDFMRTKDLGFDGDRVVLAIQFKGDLNPLQIERLANEIKSRPGLIQGVTGASLGLWLISCWTAGWRSTPTALTWAWGGLCWRAWACSRLRWLPSAARRGWRRGPIRRMRCDTSKYSTIAGTPWTRPTRFGADA